MTVMRTFTIKTGALIVAMILAGYWWSPAFAAATISIASSGNRSYDLQGIGVSGAAAFEITISYDPAGLSGPNVDQGALVSGAMMAVNANVPGTIRIALIRTTPVEGTGSIASIAFSGAGSSRGITALSAALSDINGKPLASQVQISNAVSTPDAGIESAASVESTSGSQVDLGRGTSSSGGSDDAAAGSEAGPAVIAAGIAPIPKTPEPRPEVQPPLPELPDETSPETPSTMEEELKLASKINRDQEPLASKNLYTQESVLERFRNYRGAKSAQAYIMLFRQESLIGFRQTPGVVISDGSTPARVSFISTTETKASPDVALTNARLLSLARDPDNSNTWIAQVLPERGALNASLAISQANLSMIFPLVVAPPCSIDLCRKGAVDERAFSLFLSDAPANGKLKYDLNNDGKRDVVDDYIFTANYLAAGRSSTAPSLK